MIDSRGQLLPKKPELINVFQQRRVEEKKREDERMREQTKLEQILARQRQKLDEVNKSFVIQLKTKIFI
jgi:hypothetical protein